MKDVPVSSSRGQPVALVLQQFPPLREQEEEEAERPQPGDLSSHLQDPVRGANLSYLGHNTAKSLAVLTQEGGAPLINLLLAMVIPPHEQSALLSTQSVRDWHFQDILWLPTRGREEWKKASLKELESLRARKC